MFKSSIILNMHFAILKTVQNGELELRLNKQKTDSWISFNDSKIIDFSESEKKTHPVLWEKVPKIAIYAFQCGGHLVHSQLKT